MYIIPSDQPVADLKVMSVYQLKSRKFLFTLRLCRSDTNGIGTALDHSPLLPDNAYNRAAISAGKIGKDDIRTGSSGFAGNPSIRTASHNLASVDFKEFAVGEMRIRTRNRGKTPDAVMNLLCGQRPVYDALLF